MSVAELLTAVRSRAAACRQYALAHDHWAETEQIATASGELGVAAMARTLAATCLGAWLAEANDPEPEGEA